MSPREKGTRLRYGNWLRVALVATEKAMQVSQLPPAEYNYGFKYTKRKT